MPIAAGMAIIASAWGVDLSRAEASENLERLVSELSEPVTQRILRPVEVLRDGDMDFSMMYGYICFWPTGAHAFTNVLCAIMQARPCQPCRFESMLVGFGKPDVFEMRLPLSAGRKPHLQPLHAFKHLVPGLALHNFQSRCQVT